MNRFIFVAPLLIASAVAVPGAEPAKPPFYADKANLLVYLDADGKSVPVHSAADWQKRREHILANMQLVMGPLPPDSRKVPLDLKVESEETLDKVVRKKITFAVEKDDRLTAFLLIRRERKHFEVSGVRDCVAAARPVYKLLDAADNLEIVHPDVAHDFPEEVRKQANTFMDKHLRQRDK
jgi:hypothetical protein